MNLIRNKIAIKKIQEVSIERSPVYILGTDYKVKIVYRNVRVPELDIDNKTIKISLPNKYKKTENKKILDLAIEKMYEQIAKVEIERAMEKIRILLGFAPDDYKIKNMKNEIGRCKNNTITINPKIVMFHRNIIDYVVLHEYCHLKYKTHCKSFYKMLEEYEENYEKYEEIIKSNLFEL